MTCKPGEHAFLILAHRCDKTLDVLLRMLDDVHNDVFVRMDAKCRGYEPDYCAQQFEHATFYSTVQGRSRFSETTSALFFRHF